MTDSSSEAVPGESTPSETDVKPSEASTEEIDVSGQSSPEEDKGVETTLLGAVTAALNKDDAEPPAAEDGKENASPPETTTEAKKVDEPEELSEDDLKQLAPRTQTRIRYLNDQVKGLNTQVEKQKEGVELSEQILGYMETNDISSEEFQNTLQLTTLIKNGEVEKALEVLNPVYRELLDRSGRILPDDLKEQVRLGKITEANARELHQSRATAKNATTRETQTRESGEKTRAEESWNAQLNLAQTTASEWDRAKAASDPDWHLKQQLVANELELELRRGGRGAYPNTRGAVTALAEKALKAVDGRLKAFAPKPTPRDMPRGGAASSRSAPEPGSVLEAARAAVGG